MFSWVNKILMALILGLCAWSWGQSQRISSLKAENQTQAQTISIQSNTISQLKADIEQNRKLTEEITKVEMEMRSKSDEVIRHIPINVKASDAYRADAPKSVVGFLQQ